MLTERSLTEALLLCQDRRKAIREMSTILTEWDVTLEQEEAALKSLAQIAHSNENLVMLDGDR